MPDSPKGPAKAHQPRLSRQLVPYVTSLAEDLRTEAEGRQDEYCAETEQWQESEAGVNLAAWTVRLFNLADELDNLAEEPDA